MKENNILLAKFLGWREVVPNGWKFQATMPNYISVDVPNFDFREIDTIDTFETPHDDMKFDSDWNWLMLVVDKIESLTYRVRFEMGTCFILNDDFETIIESTGSERSKIEAVYNTCVEFIKWYNDNK